MNAIETDIKFLAPELLEIADRNTPDVFSSDRESIPWIRAPRNKFKFSGSTFNPVADMVALEVWDKMMADGSLTATNLAEVRIVLPMDGGVISDVSNWQMVELFNGMDDELRKVAASNSLIVNNMRLSDNGLFLLSSKGVSKRWKCIEFKCATKSIRPGSVDIVIVIGAFIAGGYKFIKDYKVLRRNVLMLAQDVISISGAMEKLVRSAKTRMIERD